MKKTPLTPEQINAKADAMARKICTSLSAFIFRNKIKKTILAEHMGIDQQNISRILDPARKSRLHTLLVMQAALEEMTGITLQCPRFTQPGGPATTTTEA